LILIFILSARPPRCSRSFILKHYFPNFPLRLRPILNCMAVVAAGSSSPAPLNPAKQKQSCLLNVLNEGTVSTNVFLRRLHNFCIGMGWLPWPILGKKLWPPVKFKNKRAIKAEEHQKILARENNRKRRDFYEICAGIWAVPKRTSPCWTARTWIGPTGLSATTTKSSPALTKPTSSRR
jgi:hypothetical protein